MLISEAFNLYIVQQIKLNNGADKTVQNYQTTLSSFVRACSDVPIGLVNQRVIAQWKLDMSSRGKQASTIKGELCKLRQVLKYLRRHGHDVIDERDIDLPKVKPKQTIWLENDEILAMINQADSLRDKAIIRALFSCGGRISEVLSLNRDSITPHPDYEGYGRAEVYGKGSKLISLSFDPITLKAIDDYLLTRRDKLPPLFISGQYRRITVSRVEQILHVIAGEAGIEKNVTPHVFRHSFATDLLVNGADLRTVQEHLNHSNITTTQIYTHVAKSRKDASYAQFHSKL